MKKSHVLTVLLSFILMNAHAQAFKVGARGGATANKINGSSFKDKFSYGYFAGGVIEIKVSKKLSVQTELLYNQVNVDTATDWRVLYKNLLNFNQLGQVKLNYITVPILLNYKLANIIQLQAGPQFGILTNSNLNVLQNGEAAIKKGNLSMVAGVQVKLLKLVISGRYVAGLDNINQVTNSDKWKSKQIQVGVGFYL